MKCPSCETVISSPAGRETCVNGMELLMVICPHCETVLGVVAQAHSSYFSKGCARGAATGAR